MTKWEDKTEMERMSKLKMTLSPELWEETKDDIKKVVDIYWDDEKRHWEESGKSKKHIFNSLKRLKEVIE